MIKIARPPPRRSSPTGPIATIAGQASSPKSYGYYIVTREMYIDYLSTVVNDNCYSEGPLGAEDTYLEIKGFGPIEEKCYDTALEKEYDFACRKYYDNGGIDGICAKHKYSTDDCLG